MGKRNPAQVTLRDIAEATGVTINTVSHALKDKPDISVETKQRIRLVAEEMGYVGNALAGSMRTGCTRMIALILGDIANPNFAVVAYDAERTARKAGYHTILYNTEENPELELQAIRSALAQKADGLIICPTQQSRRNLNYLKRCGVPFVLVGRCFDGEDLPGTVMDDETGGLLATRHLLNAGHKRIVLLEGPDYISSAAQRRRGYERALHEANVPLDPALICPVEVSTGGCSRAIDSLFARHIAFSAVFAFSDLLALEAVSALNRHGLQVPRDISMVGFDNIAARFPVPQPLCSVSATDDASMAEHAMLQLLALLNGKPQCKKVLPVSLALRDSVQPYYP